MNLKSTLKRPAVLWTALALLVLLGALLVPMDWIDQVGDFIGEQGSETSAFAEDVARVDKSLREGEDPGASTEELRRMLPHLQVRRMLDAGPMTASEVNEATELLAEFNAQIASQKQEGSRQALRKQRNLELADKFPRLDRQKLADALAELRGQLEDTGMRLGETQ
ncbi:MAG: hypothetical protein ACLFVJ_20925 [Persicimonas sp.]